MQRKVGNTMSQRTETGDQSKIKLSLSRIERRQNDLKYKVNKTSVALQ